MLAKKSPKNVYAHDAANTHQNTLYIVVHDSALHNALTNRPLNKLKGIKIHMGSADGGHNFMP